MCIKVKQTHYDCVTTEFGVQKVLRPHRDTQDSNRAEASQRANADTENSSLTSYYSPQVHTSPHQLDVHAGEGFTMFRLMSPSCVCLAPLSSLPKHTYTHTHAQKKRKERKKEPQVGAFLLLWSPQPSVFHMNRECKFSAAPSIKKKKVFCCCSERAPLIYACQG